MAIRLTGGPVCDGCPPVFAPEVVNLFSTIAEEIACGSVHTDFEAALLGTVIGLLVDKVAGCALAWLDTTEDAVVVGTLTLVFFCTFWSWV